MNTEIASLQARLPELAYKLQLLAHALKPTLLPRGLFRTQTAFNSTQYIDEIQADLILLSQQRAQSISFHYISKQVERKVTALVHFCQKTPAAVKPIVSTVNAITTRQQWLHNLVATYAQKQEQYQALQHTLATQQQKAAQDIVLALQQALGELTKEITGLRETYFKATGVNFENDSHLDLC